MNTTTSDAPETVPCAAGSPRPARWRRWITVPFKVAVAAVLMQTLLGAILVFGWLQRWTRRAAIHAWWRQSPGRPRRFVDSFPLQPWLEHDCHAPNWLLGPRSLSRQKSHWLTSLFGSATDHLRLGVAGLANTLALTLPGATLMALGWWGGWQNSFHKGYEQSLVGPLVSWLGVLLFVASMFVVPTALARQAVSGRWREFWQWRTNWIVIRHSWAGCAGVAILAAALQTGVMALKTWPYFVPQARMAEAARRPVPPPVTPSPAPVSADPADAPSATLPAEPTLDSTTEPAAPMDTPSASLALTSEGPNWNDLSDADARSLLRRHHLRSALLVFGALLLLRSAVGRVYAGGVLRAVQRGALGEDRLADEEWRALHSLGLLAVTPARPRHFLVRVAAWAATRTGRVVCGCAVFLAWFAFVAAVYISEFLNFHPVTGFLNQPLIQLPWFSYVPAHLQNPWPEVAVTVISLAAMGILFRLTRRRAAAPHFFATQERKNPASSSLRT